MDRQFIKSRLAMWLEAEAAAAQGKSYTIDGLSFTRQDLDQIMKQIAYWRSKLSRLDRRGGLRVSYVLQADDRPRG